MAALPDTCHVFAHLAEQTGLFAVPALMKERGRRRRHSQRTYHWSGVAALCGVGAIELTAPQQTSVQDVTAPPPVRPGVYKLAPRTVPLKNTRYRRRAGGGGCGDGEGGYGGDTGDGSSGGFGGGGDDHYNGGRGGWDRWGDGWNDEWGQWKKNGDAIILLYHAVCWMSLSRCLHHAFSTSMGFGGRTNEPTGRDPGAFAQCTSVFQNSPVIVMSNTGVIEVS